MSRFKTVILIVGMICTAADSMRFDITSGSTKCISEDIKANAMTVGKYSVINPNEGFPFPDTHKITARVSLNSSFETLAPCLVVEKGKSESY